MEYPVKKTTTLEEMSFDGMTARILEKRPSHDPEQTLHRFEITLGAFGAHSTISFPLGTPAMARMMADAMTRTAERMESQPLAGGKYPTFKREQPLHRTVKVRDGLRLRPVFTYAYVTGPWTTGSNILGVDWLDDQDQVVRFEPVKPHQDHGSGGSGSKPFYAPHEIGRRTRDVMVERAARADVGALEALPVDDEITTIGRRYVDRDADPAVLVEGDPAEEVGRLIDSLSMKAEEREIAQVIRTFHNMPVIRRDKDERRRFTQRLANHFGWEPQEAAALVRRYKAD